MKRTEQEVQEFVAGAVQQGNNIVSGIWGPGRFEGTEALSLATDSSNWAVEESFRPEDEEADYWNDHYDVYEDLEAFSPRGPHYTRASRVIELEDVAGVHLVCLEAHGFDEFVRFLVIEDTQNNLILSEFVGD